jgi:4-diphosphocytidyl-2-C-methyl-D-erythritol kinase
VLLLNELFGLERPWRELAEFSADYGSDIGFFTQPNAAICQGRGEIVTPIPSPNVGWFTIVRPPFGLSTPSVFAEYAKGNSPNCRIETMLEGEIRDFSGFLSKGQLRCWAIIAANDLQRPAVSLKEELVTLSACCAVNHPIAHLLTGSGSCWYSVFRNRRQAVWAANRLRGRRVGRVEIAKSMTAAF